jgi:hypothetical protein
MDNNIGNPSLWAEHGPSKEERAAERQERKEVAAMHVKSFDKFSGAIDNLTDELKKGKDKSYSIGVDLVGSEKGLR